MADQSMFTEQQKPADQAAAPQLGHELLSAIVDAEGRPKYADVNTALEALKHAQEYIPQLHTKLDTQQAELQKFQTELSSRDTVQDFVERLRTPESQTPPVESAPAATGLDAEAAAKLFDQLVTAREAEQAKKTNQSAVVRALQEKFGDKAEEAFNKKAADLGLTLDQLNSLSSTSPKAVLAYFGTSSERTSIDVSQGSVNSEGIRQEAPMEWGNYGKSVLSGSTAKDVRAESERVKNLVARIHESGGSIEALTDPKEYNRTFAQRNS